MESFEDTTIIVLVVAAVVSLAIGIYEDPAKGWIEGAAILFAVMIVAVVTASNNYNKELQFRKLNAVKDDVSVSVIRDGLHTTINVKQLVVGDIVVLNAGDRVPADGLLVAGSDVTCNESSLTGESDDRKKFIGEGGDVFLLSGTNLATGYAHMVVTAVGENSRWGKTKAKLAAETSDTPLQEKLDVLAGQIGNFGMVSAGMTFIAMLIIRYYSPSSSHELSFLEYMLKAFIMAVTIVVVAVPEGLPLAVTLSLAYSTQKMMKDNNLIRVLAACETMGNATNICSDKTGTLTQNRMTVVEGWICGQYCEDINKLQDVSPKVQLLISEGISVNSTANIMFDANPPVVVGNKTEGALVLFIKSLFESDYVSLRKNFDSSRGDRLLTFSSARKRMSVVLMNDFYGKGTGVVYTKGASEVIVERCREYITATGEKKPLDGETKKSVYEAIERMARNALRTVALAHRELKNITGKEDADDLENNLVLQGIVGIKDPLRPDVIEAVRLCQDAGIFVRMVTGDNIETAKAIARECGILTKEGEALEGPAFRKLTPQQLDEILPRLQVLARSSPDDKHTLVTRLNGKQLPNNEEEWNLVHKDCDWEKQKDLLLPGYREEWEKSHIHGEVVGVTGDGTNDGPAMKAADVGLSMGLSGTDGKKIIV
jgi:Ca2+-transporting ATPase